MRSPVSSLPAHAAVLLALLALTAATTWAAVLPLGAWHVPVALCIAAGKTALVAAWFMGLPRSPRLVRMAAAAGVFWLLVLMSLTLTDVVAR
jgi:cytochrome c oxidase subunit 4